MPGRIEAVGGVLGAAVITTLASQGAQYVAIILYNRGTGDLNRNVLLGLSANIMVTALATASVPVIKELFIAAGIGFGALVFASGLLSDARALMAPKGGVAIFLATFNPFHLTHLDLVRRALDERRLDKVVIHPAIAPCLHVIALARGEIRVGRVEGGIQVLERTTKADANVDYFPTGNRFMAPETRRILIEAAIADAGLEDRVEVAFWPELYADKGFHGVIARIRAEHPGARLYAIHGNDVGGMAVRSIVDECGWIYPFAVRRRDAISATAIRADAEGMTAPPVTDALNALREGRSEIAIQGRNYGNDDGVLRRA